MRIGGRQRALHDALGELDEALARMYLGALLALRQTENPDRLALAVHDMRELMEKLARHNNNDTEGDGQLVTTTMMQQARMLDAEWCTTAQRSKCHQGGRWEGEIDDPLRKGLGAVRRFLDWVDAMRRGPSELYSVQHPMNSQPSRSDRTRPSSTTSRAKLMKRSLVTRAFTMLKAIAPAARRSLRTKIGVPTQHIPRTVSSSSTE